MQHRWMKEKSENNLSQYPPLSPKKKWTISILSETFLTHLSAIFFSDQTQANHESCCSRLSFPSMTLFTSLSLLLHKKTFFYLLHKTVVLGSICAKKNKKVQLVGGYIFHTQFKQTKQKLILVLNKHYFILLHYFYIF